MRNASILVLFIVLCFALVRYADSLYYADRAQLGDVSLTAKLTEQQTLDEIATQEAAAYTKDGKYAQIKVNESSLSKEPAYKYEVLPYDGPMGKGYDVSLYSTTTLKSATGTDIVTVIKRVGYGPEAQYRTWDWR